MPVHELTPIAVERFREVMSSVCTPVCVVTTLHDGRAYGTTVSSFCSLSLDPPLMLVALGRRSRLLRRLRATRVFGVNVLAHGQQDDALRLGSKDPDKFDDVMWVSDAGLPRLVGAPGWLACRVHRLLDGGDHVIVTGLIVRAEREVRAPLLYHERTFTTHSR